MQSQNQRVLKYLQSFGTINPMDAWNMLGIYRLGARIHDLRNMGHSIRTENMSAKNRYGEPVRYARYVMDSQKG